MGRAGDCIPSVRLAGAFHKNKKAGGPAFLVLRGPWAGAALALGFGLLAFGLGLFLAFRLGGLLALRFRGRRRGRGLRGCRRRGGRLRCDVESRACECGEHQDCEQLFHLEPRSELMSIAADMYSINARLPPALTLCPESFADVARGRRFPHSRTISNKCLGKKSRSASSAQAVSEADWRPASLARE